MRTAPVNQLPPELLIPIFSQIDDPHPNASDVGDDWRTINHKTMWPVVLRVCKYWYKVASDAPLLWQYIHVYSKPDWLKLSLERSGTALVDVTLQRHQGYAASIPLLIDHASRLRTLAILDSKQGSFHLVKRLLLHQLRNLQELRLFGEDYLEDNAYVNMKPPMGQWPAIRVLRLTHLVLPVRPAVLGRLRILDLSHMQGNLEMRTMPLKIALTLLSACDELQELKLNAVFPELFGESDILVPLPHIRRVEVISEVGPTVRSPFPASPLVSHMLLRHVELPLHASLKFVSHVKAAAPVGYRSFIPPENLSCIPILRHATFACLRRNSFICSEPGGGTLEVAVEFDDADADVWFDQDRQLRDMSFLLSRAPLTHLSLISAQLHSGSIATAFNTFPGLTTLEFATDPTHGDGRPEDWRVPALLSPLILPAEAHQLDFRAPDDLDHQYLMTRLPLKNLRVLRFNGLLRGILNLIVGYLHTRNTILGAPRLSELYVGVYGPKTEDAEDAAKGCKDTEMLETLVDGPVVYEDCEPPTSSSPGDSP